MIQIRPILLTLGSLLCVLAVLMLVPALVALEDAPGVWIAFLASAAFTLFVGGLFVLPATDIAAFAWAFVRDFC